MNSESYFCQVYPIKFCSFLVVLILCKTTLRLLELLFALDVTCLNLHKLQKNFELVVTEDNTKYTNSTVYLMSAKM